MTPITSTYKALKFSRLAAKLPSLKVSEYTCTNRLAMARNSRSISVTFEPTM
jgi:hypothetical protein